MDYKDDTKDVSLSTYNDMLPVQSQPSDSRAIVLLIDSSGSMSGASLSNAKEGAKEVAKLLNKGDQISVVTFESNVTIVQPMTSITSEDGRNEIIKNIENKLLLVVEQKCSKVWKLLMVKSRVLLLNTRALLL